MTFSPGSKAQSAVSPVLNLSQALLAPRRGFLEPLSRIYDCAFGAHTSQLVLIQGMGISGPFLNDPSYRERALENLCEMMLQEPALLISHPPSIFWRPTDPDAQFRLHSVADRDLLLCMLLGQLGFAQVCDDMLHQPIPLLIRPWNPQHGLLRPRHVPKKSYSQTLCVERIGHRRLLLFDKQSSRN